MSLTLGIFWLASWIKNRSLPRAAIVDGLWWGGTLFVALIPWMIMSMRSNGSPLFPLFPGGNNAPFDPQGLEWAPFSTAWPFPMMQMLS